MDKNVITISCTPLAIPPTPVLFPISNSIIFDQKSSQGAGPGITALALSNDGSRFVFGGAKGKIWIGKSDEVSERGKWKEGRGCVGDINALNFVSRPIVILRASL